MMFLQDRVDEFMRPFIYENGQWFYRPKGADVSVPLTEQQVNDAEDLFRFRYKLGFIAMWAVVLPALAWVYVQFMVHDRSFLFFFAVVPAYYVGFLFLLWAMASASRSSREKLWDLEVEKHEGEPEDAPKTPWHGVPSRKVTVQRTWLLFLMFVGWSALTLWEHRNNVRALHGVTIAAKVTRSDSRDSGKCHVDYAYEWGGTTHRDSTLGCALMRNHPVGGSLRVLVDPDRPGHSILPGTSPWPSETFIPVVLGPILLFLIVVL